MGGSFVTVTKEMLDELGVKSFIICASGKDIMCRPVRIKNRRWYIGITAAKGGLPGTGEAVIRINRNNRISEGKITVLEPYGDDTVLAVEPHSDSDDFREVIERLSRYESNDNFERRKETRIKVGIKNATLFGLASPVQRAVFGRDERECVIFDASVHGIQLIMENSRIISGTNIFKAKVSFQEPEQGIVLALNRVYSKVKETPERNYIYISAQILEPVHYVWKDRVIACLADKSNLI